MKLTVQLLGPPRIELDGRPIEVDTRKAIALLAYLAAADQVQQRSVLAALLWPESDDTRARSALRRTLATLNRAIEGPWLDATRTTIELVQDENLAVDVTRVRRLLKQCRTAENECAACIPLLEEAVSHFRGVFLEGFTLYDSPEFDEWQRLEEEAWQRELSWSLERLITCYQEAGNYESAVKHAHSWLALDNLHEPAHQALMRLYALSGQRTAAIRQYESCQELLEEALGIEPQAETTAIYERIRSGEFREKTVAALAPAGGTSPEPSRPSSPPPSRLPQQSTSFIGREEELKEILDLLDDPKNRLITILGPGGIGKTRLSLEVGARRDGDYQHGVFFIPLGPVSAVDYLAPTIADALNISFATGGGSDPRSQLLNNLREKEMLLILDNFEHLMEGVDLVADILRQSPGVQLLITSQERLNLVEEWLVELYGLQCPNGSEDIESCSAVKLFQQRATQVNAAFSSDAEAWPHISRICHLVGGMPLGIELASTWTRILSCKAIADQIEESMDFLASGVRNIPERHRSMRAVFEHSWRLLAEEERVVFRKLSVFRGGFTAEAAGQVAGASLPILLALTNKSLLASNRSGRFEIQEVLHQFAHEKFQGDLPKETRQEVEARHSAFYLNFLQEKEADLRSQGQKAALAQIGEVIENVRQAWQWAVAHKDFSALSDAIEPLYRFYEIRSWFQEGEALFRQLAETLEAAGSNRLLLGRALSRQGRMQVRLSLLKEGQETLQRSLEILRQQEDNKGEIAAVLSILGVILEATGRFEESRRRHEESLSLWREINDTRGIAAALLRLGNVANALGTYNDAQKNYQDSLVRRRQIGDMRGVALCLNNLGSVAETLGRYQEARQLYEESVAIKRDLGDRRGVAYSLNNIGFISCLLEEYEAARLYLQESQLIFKEIDDKRGLGFALTNLGSVAAGLGNVDQAQTYYQESLAICREMDFLIGAAYALNHLGVTSVELGDYEGAKQYFSEALTAALSINALPVILEILVGVARLMVSESQGEDAVSLLAFILSNPSSRKESLNKAQKLMAEISPELTQESAEKAKKSGAESDLAVVINSILEWLRAT